MAVCTQCGTALPSDARFCPSCAAPVQQAPAPADERKVATVLFADLVGSTAMAASQDPERTRAMLDRFYDAMAAEIERAGGTVEKFVGDAVMAAFGAPVALEDHAERALHVALAMQHRLGELFGEQLALRVGVNTGEVVVGRPREGSSFVTGDAVNVGARLEQAAAPREILAGERTVTAVRGAFEFAERRTVDAKGKAGGVVCRRLVRALSLMRPRGIGMLRQAFVGREREVEQLRATYEQVVLDHEPRLVTIIGDAGVGKTRLVRELWAWLADQEPPPLQRTGRCLSYGRGIAYWPLAEVLREHFGILESDPADVAAARLGNRPFLGLTLGLPVGEDLHPLVGRERLHDAWVELLGDLVRERPSVLLIEDLHWAEDDLCDLIETLVRGVDGPLLVLTTARPELLERRPGWGGARYNASLLTLEALPPDEVAHLLDELLGAELPPALRSIVVERAEGNPFFVEELIATLIDRGVLERLNGGWSYARLPEGFHVPDTVQAVLAARIDLLPPAEKGALQAASVIGRVFWTGPVYDLVEGTAPDFTVLEERDFVRRRHGSSMTGEREYAIKHALTREVAYESLPKARRARLHAGFAEWLERSGRAEDEHAPLLAHHYAQAVRPEDVDLAWPRAEEQIATLRQKALHWSRRAAELAIGRYEIDEGLSLLHQAVALQPERQEQAELWEEIGHANALKFDGESFREAIEQAIELGGASAERYTELALQTARRSGMWKRMPDPKLAESWLDRALELAQPGTPTYSRALAAAALWRKDETAALELHAITEDAGDPDLRSSALAALADVAWSDGDLDRVRRCVEERLSLLPDLSDPDDRHFALMSGVNINLETGRLSQARELSLRLQEMVEGLTPHHRLHGVAVRIDVEAWAGYWETVRELTPSVEQAVEANKATPCPANATSLLYCAAAHVGVSRDEVQRLEAQADAHRLEGFESHHQMGDLRLALARNNSGALRRLVDSLDTRVFASIRRDPAAYLDALLVLGEDERIEAEAPELARRGTYVEPFALRALGLVRHDSDAIRQAVARFEAMGLDRHAAETAELARGRGRGGERKEQ